MKPSPENPPGNTYTCKEYRDEMILVGLQRALNKPGISEEERQKLLDELEKLEEKMGL